MDKFANNLISLLAALDTIKPIKLIFIVFLHISIQIIALKNKAIIRISLFRTILRLITLLRQNLNTAYKFLDFQINND
jgi:hypothetical protein